MLVSRRLLVCMLFALIPFNCVADDFLLSLGGGRQSGSDQHNTQVAIDYDFWQLHRSARTTFSLGIGYTHLSTNAERYKTINAISIYPQITLNPVRESLSDYYFFVRALGPSYISDNSLGDREQDNHFAFQAQVGVGLERPLANGSTFLLQVSWKHFSNANLFNDNDGIDLPFVLSFGYRF